MRYMRSRLSRACILALALASGAAGLGAQAIEVLESSGYAEVLLPDIGWRQAVVGRQVGAGSVLTSWLGARAKFEYQGGLLELGPLSRLRVLALAVEPASARLSLAEGRLSIDTKGTAFELEYRGMTIKVESGSIALSGGLLSVASGSATLSGYDSAPLILSAGERLSLLDRESGPVFKTDRR
jgi:hypothetical protein